MSLTLESTNNEVRKEFARRLSLREQTFGSLALLKTVVERSPALCNTTESHAASATRGSLVMAEGTAHPKLPLLEYIFEYAHLNISCQ